MEQSPHSLSPLWLLSFNFLKTLLIYRLNNRREKSECFGSDQLLRKYQFFQYRAFTGLLLFHICPIGCIVSLFITQKSMITDQRQVKLSPRLHYLLQSEKSVCTGSSFTESALFLSQYFSVVDCSFVFKVTAYNLCHCQKG